MANVELTSDLIAFIRDAKDRQEIWDCILRYTRGVDRHDHELMCSAYHPDALDEHGFIEAGPKDFVDWAIGFHEQGQIGHHHIVTNHVVELDGDVAHSETYYLFLAENREGPPTLGYGRYIDGFEKRDGRWAIAHRVCINEYAGNFDIATLPDEWKAKIFSTGPNRRDRDDLSYRRPLTRERQRVHY